MSDLDGVPMDKGQTGGWAETVKTVAYAVLIAVFVRSFAFEPFNIPSGSMVPSLLIGDYLFVSKYSYGYSRYSFPFGLSLFSGRLLAKLPERGDVIVFKKPKENKVDYIKRLIGLPGDHIQMINGILNINGVPVVREKIGDFIDKDRDGIIVRAPHYIETLPNGKQHQIIEYFGDNGPADNTIEYVVPEGHYFMMGDNRDNSQDSRFLDQVGYVPYENLVGRAEMIFFSVDGSAAWWQVWSWPWAIRYSRLFDKIG
jgi:signal peptidase I